MNTRVTLHFPVGHDALMNKEMYTVIGVGVALAAVLIASLSGLRAEMTMLRAEMRDGQASLRAEVRDGQASLRAEMREDRVMLQAELVDVRASVAQLGERMARLEATLGVPPADSAAAGQ